MTNYIIIMFFDVIIMTFQLLLIFLFDNYDFSSQNRLGSISKTYYVNFIFHSYVYHTNDNN